MINLLIFSKYLYKIILTESDKNKRLISNQYWLPAKNRNDYPWKTKKPGQANSE